MSKFNTYQKSLKHSISFYNKIPFLNQNFVFRNLLYFYISIMELRNQKNLSLTRPGKGSWIPSWRKDILIESESYYAKLVKYFFIQKNEKNLCLYWKGKQVMCLTIPFHNHKVENKKKRRKKRISLKYSAKLNRILPNHNKTYYFQFFIWIQIMYLNRIYLDCTLFLFEMVKTL